MTPITADTVCDNIRETPVEFRAATDSITVQFISRQDLVAKIPSNLYFLLLAAVETHFIHIFAQFIRHQL